MIAAEVEFHGKYIEHTACARVVWDLRNNYNQKKKLWRKTTEMSLVIFDVSL